MTDNAAALRQLLLSAPRGSLPMTYQQVASALALAPPRTIAQVTQALELLMREDAAQHKPFTAALVVSRRGDGLPAAGFFELAVALGRFPADTAQHEVAYRIEFQRALNERENDYKNEQR
ncbi:hypothetical protein [Vreelandella boliviensis]|uniref:Uncharacterized protein n=1 Tax=Vreelandella boliviensis LC1 TaxID=1072583 RepID=A0A265DWD6_9GAMM|nr:hypothetical protein [Halomonas boliviensis]EHJ92560.1 hypothetical protein KUC_2517 [Halomonas boliviensis LC1]OZT73639.1 hypothetical protein CE457_13665 [Halomonas boliviensis LC1]